MFMICPNLSANRVLWRSASAIRPDDAHFQAVKFSAIDDGDYASHVSAHIPGSSSQHYVNKFESLAFDHGTSGMLILHQAMKATLLVDCT